MISKHQADWLKQRGLPLPTLGKPNLAAVIKWSHGSTLVLLALKMVRMDAFHKGVPRLNRICTS